MAGGWGGWPSTPPILTFMVKNNGGDDKGGDKDEDRGNNRVLLLHIC